MKTLFVAEDEPIIRMDLCEIFENAGYKVVGSAADGFDAVSMCRKLKPDIIIMDIKMPLLDGLKASKMMKDQGLESCIILLTSFFDKELVERSKRIGVMGYIVKPVNAEKMLPMIEILLAKNEEINQLKRKLSQTNKKLADRKIIEKAKGVIMDEMKLSEEKAFSYLRKLSMDKQCSMDEIAEVIIRNSDNEGTCYD